MTAFSDLNKEHLCRSAAATSPIVLGDPKYGTNTCGRYIGGMAFANVSIVDSLDRPFASFVPLAGSWGAADITGSVSVRNRFGCRHALGNATASAVHEDAFALIDLEVDCGPDEPELELGS